MAHQDMDTLPEFVSVAFPANVPDDPANVIKWSGKAPPPAIGDKITVAMNGLGHATVTGYFVDSGWLGVRCRLHDAPGWHRKQNSNDPTAYIYGAELA